MFVRKNSVGEGGQGGMGGLSERDRAVVSHGHGGQARGDRTPANEGQIVALEATNAIQPPRSPQDVAVGPLARDPELLIVIDKLVAT